LKQFVTIEEIAAALGISVEAAQERADAESWPYIEEPMRRGKPQCTHINDRSVATRAAHRRTRQSNH